jgi:hypothetical protein
MHAQHADNSAMANWSLQNLQRRTGDQLSIAIAAQRLGSSFGSCALRPVAPALQRTPLCCYATSRLRIWPHDLGECGLFRIPFNHGASAQIAPALFQRDLRVCNAHEENKADARAS